MKKALFALFGCLFYLFSLGQKTERASSGWYIGINPLSYAMSVPLKEEIKRYGPVMSGNEYGFNVVGGYYLQPKLQSEIRLSLGNIHQVAWVGQIHGGINYHFLFKEGRSHNKGLYAGLFLKYWDYNNRLTHIHFFNLSPYATMGHQWNKDKWIIDLRLNQTIAVHSWTSLKDVKSGTAWSLSPWPEFIPILPTVNLTLGYSLASAKHNHHKRAGIS